ncbi:MAG TPA: MFS transporter [Bryobacteraceae bacterium]|nr:MFS transporter [Bryobacteraceae bacterium]
MPSNRGPVFRMGSSFDLTQTLRALRSRNYRLFFAGQSVSLIGTWMTRIATSWLVYRLTDSAFLLGITGFAGQIPAFFLAPLAGVWIDRWNRHRTLVVTQILAMIQSLALAALALSGLINIWWIIGLVFFQGLINAFDMPARQAFVVEMIEQRSDLGNAIALNSSMVNGARLIGPAIAGVIIAAAGEGYCFLIDGLSYIAVVASLLAMNIRPAEARVSNKRVLEELAEGWKYVTASPPIRSILLLLALVSLVGMPYSVLVPIMAGGILHGDANTLGFLMGMSGVGALVSAISLAMRRSVVGLGRMIPISAAIFGAGLAFFGLSRLLWISLVMMMFVGFGMMQQMAASNTILQTIVEDDKRGRVMSFYTLAILGVAPIGSLVAGSVAAKIGTPATLMIGGVLCAVGGLWFWRKLPVLRNHIRPIYVELGILPEMAKGLQSASALQAPPEG